MRNAKLIIAFAISIITGPSVYGQYKYPFQNPELSADQRIDDLLSLLTIEEKVDFLGKTMNLPRLGIHASGIIDSIPGSSGQFEGLHGLAVGGSNDWGRRSPGGHGHWGGTSMIPTTQFPQAVGLGETWDPALVRKAAAEEGYEARYIFQSLGRGGLIVRAPNADLARDPRWGRSEESFGEDPFLVGTMSVAFVRGLQGEDGRHWLTASLVKHFLANSNEDGRTGSSSDFDSRLLREYYSLPFRMAIQQGGADSAMAAYNAVNGIPMTASPLLGAMLSKEWGLKGIIDTDRGALANMVTQHKYYPDLAHAAAGAIYAGINQFLDSYESPVNAALQKGLLTEADLDQSLRGLFRTMIHLGFLDPPDLDPYSNIRAAEGVPAPWDAEASKKLALDLTRESVVLLKNATQLLPLDKSSIKSIAVVGPLANVVYMDGYSGTAPFAVTPLQGIRDRAGSGIDVRSSWDNIAAVQLARTSDVAIVVVGNWPLCHPRRDPAPCPDPTEGQEGVDRKRIDLRPEQEKLIEDVYAANPRTIVVVVSSFPYAIRWAKEHVPSILHMAHNSEAEGYALADVIFGDYNPAGRLVVTWPHSLSQFPPMMDYDLRHGRTYMYSRSEPLFPFGYGLSYTTFAYSGLQTSSSTLSPGHPIKVSLQVKNTGRRSGDEVVQMYVQYVHSQTTRPALELKGFKRVFVPDRKAKLVRIPLHAESLMYWNESRHKWSLENGEVRILVGSSSRDIRLSKVIKVEPWQKRAERP